MAPISSSAFTPNLQTGFLGAFLHILFFIMIINLVCLCTAENLRKTSGLEWTIASD